MVGLLAKGPEKNEATYLNKLQAVYKSGTVVNLWSLGKTKSLIMNSFFVRL